MCHAAKTEMVHHKQIEVQFQTISQFGLRWVQQFHYAVLCLFLILRREIYAGQTPY